MMTIEKANVCGEAWFEETWSERIIGGKIEKLDYTEPSKNNPTPLPYVTIVSEDEILHGKFSRLLSECYPTKDEALAAKKQNVESRKATYREQINTVADLVTFMYNNTVSTGEYTDWEARSVAAEKAKDLLGIDLGI